MKALIRLAALAIAVASASATTAHSAPLPELPSESRELFERGAAELEAESPDYEEAYRNFKLAYERSRDYRVLASLAHAAEALERDGEAIQAYAEYLARAGAELPAEERSAIERALRALQANTGRVIVTSSVPDLAIVDSRVGSEAPPQVYRLEQGRLEAELRAGTHLLTATNGGDRLEWQVAIVPGVSAEHRFEFVKERRRDTVGGSARESAGSPNGTLRVVAISAAGVGTAAIVAGAVTGLLVLAKEEDARARCGRREFGRIACPESARAEFDSASSLATTTNILFVGGGILTLAGVGAWLLSAPRSDPSTSVRIVPEVSARVTGLSVSGAF